MMQPVVEDARELNEMAQASYRLVSNFNLRATANEAVILYVSAMRMPSMLFERLADNLEQVTISMQKTGGKSTLPSRHTKISPYDFFKSIERL